MTIASFIAAMEADERVAVTGEGHRYDFANSFDAMDGLPTSVLKATMDEAMWIKRDVLPEIGPNEPYWALHFGGWNA
jgi:hypothetical protein